MKRMHLTDTDIAMLEASSPLENIILKDLDRVQAEVSVDGSVIHNKLELAFTQALPLFESLSTEQNDHNAARQALDVLETLVCIEEAFAKESVTSCRAKFDKILDSLKCLPLISTLASDTVAQRRVDLLNVLLRTLDGVIGTEEQS